MNFYRNVGWNSEFPFVWWMHGDVEWLVVQCTPILFYWHISTFSILKMNVFAYPHPVAIALFHVLPFLTFAPLYYLLFTIFTLVTIYQLVFVHSYNFIYMMILRYKDKDLHSFLCPAFGRLLASWWSDGWVCLIYLHPNAVNGKSDIPEMGNRRKKGKQYTRGECNTWYTVVMITEKTHVTNILRIMQCKLEQSSSKMNVKENFLDKNCNENEWSVVA